MHACVRAAAAFVAIPMSVAARKAGVKDETKRDAHFLHGVATSSKHPYDYVRRKLSSWKMSMVETCDVDVYTDREYSGGSM